jgi:hypothetical protein
MTDTRTPLRAAERTYNWGNAPKRLRDGEAVRIPFALMDGGQAGPALPSQQQLDAAAGARDGAHARMVDEITWPGHGKAGIGDAATMRAEADEAHRRMVDDLNRGWESGQ